MTSGKRNLWRTLFSAAFPTGIHFIFAIDNGACRCNQSSARRSVSPSCLSLHEHLAFTWLDILIFWSRYNGVENYSRFFIILLLFFNIVHYSFITFQYCLLFFYYFLFFFIILYFFLETHMLFNILLNIIYFALRIFNCKF